MTLAELVVSLLAFALLAYAFAIVLLPDVGPRSEWPQSRGVDGDPCCQRPPFAHHDRASSCGPCTPEEA